jgi:ATP-binding protein involved in chromosome partitioning
VLETPFLGAVPLDPAIMAGGDAGTPIIVTQPDGPHGQVFRGIARAVVEGVAAYAAERPQLVIH